MHQVQRLSKSKFGELFTNIAGRKKKNIEGKRTPGRTREKM